GNNGIYLGSVVKQKSLIDMDKAFLFNKGRHRPTLPPVTAVPSALAGLTSLFGMGRGDHRRYRHLKVFNLFFCITTYLIVSLHTLTFIERKKSFRLRQQRILCLESLG